MPHLSKLQLRSANLHPIVAQPIEDHHTVAVLRQESSVSN